MDFESLSKEQQIMVVMRKVLTSIVRETTPPPGMLHPLSEHTIEDIRLALGLIAAREKELLDEQGIVNNDRPHFVDEPRSSQVVSLDSLRRDKSSQE